MRAEPRGAPWLLFALATLAAALPFAILENAPLVDAPNHLARYHIMAVLDRTPELQPFYEWQPGFHPYYGMRIVFGLLQPLFGLELTGRIFTVLAVLAPPLGAIVLARAIHGRVTVPSLFALSLTLTAPANWGFLNFLFSVGFVLLAFAGWVALRERGLMLRVLLFAPLVFAAGALHLISAGILLGVVGAFEIAEASRLPRFGGLRSLGTRAGALGILAFPVLLLLVLVSHDDFGQTHHAFGSLAERLEAFTSPFALGRGVVEIALGLSSVLFLAVALAFGLLRIVPPFGRMVLLMAFVAAVVPVTLASVYAMQIRLPLIVALVLVAALDVTPRGRLFAGKALGLAAAVVILLHLAWAAMLLKEDDRRFGELRAASYAMPWGAKVMPAIDYLRAAEPGRMSGPLLSSAATLLVIDRNAYLPILFGMYEIAIRDPYVSQFPPMPGPVNYRALFAEDQPGKPRGDAGYSWGRMQDFDYVVAFDQNPAQAIPAGTELVHAGSFFKILKVLR